MPRYSEKQKSALENLMRDDVHRHAAQIITREGLEALTMERLAGEIGVSRGTLYNYFDDRDAVLDFVEERMFGPVLEAVQRIVDDDVSPTEKLTKIADTIFTAVDEDRALVVALVPNKYAGANAAKQEQRHALGIRVVEAVVRQGIDAGEFKALPPRIAAEAFIGAAIGMIELMALRGEFRPAKEVVPTVMEIFLGGVRTGG